MNILFHTATAIGIAVVLTDTQRLTSAKTCKPVLATGVAAFGIGIISHGVIDYIPHCYPIMSELDVVFGFLIMSALTYMVNRRYRLIVGLAFLGAVTPDVVDLGPTILNQVLGLNLPVLGKIFPWHLPEYSGSIYTGNCAVSTWNHLLLLVTILAICCFRRSSLKEMLKK